MTVHRGTLPKLITNPHCAGPKELHLERSTFNGKVVRLQPRAMRSFEKHVYPRIVKTCGPHGLWIASSYRTCKEQEAACNGICGDGCAGCPGLCAPCGESFHQIALAMDAGAVHPRNNAEVRRAFYDNDWHNFSSHDNLKPVGGDPWHFSYKETG